MQKAGFYLQFMPLYNFNIVYGQKYLKRARLYNRRWYCSITDPLNLVKSSYNKSGFLWQPSVTITRKACLCPLRPSETSEFCQATAAAPGYRGVLRFGSIVQSTEIFHKVSFTPFVPRWYESLSSVMLPEKVERRGHQLPSEYLIIWYFIRDKRRGCTTRCWASFVLAVSVSACMMAFFCERMIKSKGEIQWRLQKACVYRSVWRTFPKYVSQIKWLLQHHTWKLLWLSFNSIRCLFCGVFPFIQVLL